MAIFHIENSYSFFRLSLFGKRILSIHKKIPVETIQKRYELQLKRVKQKLACKEKVRVGFLVSEQSKWQYQSLYEELEASDAFEPVVLVSDLDHGFGKRHSFFLSFESNCAFFERLGLRYAKTYDPATRRHISAKEFGIDILFYQQPGDLMPVHHPGEVSQFALTCYVPYGIGLSKQKGDYRKDFHACLWRCFILNADVIATYEKLYGAPITNCIPVGYPKLDDYFKTFEPEKSEKKIVIYAPHHSFGDSGLRYATFHRNGKDMLEFAQKHKDEILWIFKPHPRFKYRVVKSGIMSADAIESYYEAWRNIGSIVESGNYIDIFRSSSAMVTDSCSFLGEYLPTEMPIFQLVESLESFNDVGKRLAASYYQIFNFEEFENEFVRVVIGEDDYKKQARLAMLPLVYNKNQKSSTTVIEEITRELM